MNSFTTTCLLLDDDELRQARKKSRQNVLFYQMCQFVLTPYLIFEEVSSEGEVFELGDLPEDGGPVPDGAGADAPHLPVL